MRIKVVEIAQDITEEAVANLAIAFGHALHQLLGADYVFAEIDGRHPEAHDFAAHAVGYIDGIDIIATRLRQSAALFVERPAIGGDRAIGSLVAGADGAQQGRMEPSAVLVAAFEIEIGGPGQAGFVAEHGGVAASGLEPDIQNVRLFCELRIAALGAFGSGRDQGVGLRCVPGVGAAAREQFDHLAVQGGIVQGLAAALAQEHRDRHAPDTLAGNTPIGAGGDHVAELRDVHEHD